MIDNSIEAKEIFIKDLFDSKFLFRIPEYQRQFSWEKDNFEQLFEDIRESLESGEGNYFLGSVILQAKDLKGDGSGIYDVVDGQQRLTTITILIAVLRDLSISKKAKLTLQDKIYQEENEFEDKKEEVRILVRDRDRDFFMKFVLEEEGTKRTPNLSTLSEPQKRIITAIEVFRSKFYQNNSLNQELMNAMIKFLLNNCIMVYVKTGNFTSAFRLFSVLNDRGMPLTTSDLLKSINLGAVEKDRRNQYQLLWEQIEEDLGIDELDKLLGFVRTIFLKDKPRKNIVDEYSEKIYKNNLISPGIEFIQYICEIAEIYEEKILNANLEAQNGVSVKFHNLMSLMRDFIPFSDWMPAFISFALKYNGSDILYSFLTLLEKLYVINWVVGATSTKRTVETGKILQVIEQSSKPEDVFKNTLFDLSSLKNQVHIEFNSDTFYKSKYSKYILLILDYDTNENNNIKKKYNGIISIEHILPQNPNSNSEWIQIFTEQERNKLTHRIGNLVLLSRKKNSSANNRNFKDKMESYYSKCMTDFELTKEIRNYDIWNHTSIQARHNEKVSILINRYFG